MPHSSWLTLPVASTHLYCIFILQQVTSFYFMLKTRDTTTATQDALMVFTFNAGQKTHSSGFSISEGLKKGTLLPVKRLLVLHLCHLSTKAADKEIWWRKEREENTQGERELGTEQRDRQRERKRRRGKVSGAATASL